MAQKRRSARPSRNTEPAQKRSRVSSPDDTRPSTVTLSPPVQSPPPIKRIPRLPPKLAENRPLPALSEAQPPGLSDTDFQSIAASAVLQTSLDRSRAKWIGEGIFARYWVKPETGKHARPPPPNNPETKWQKHQGPCRVRIEPHILEVDLYIEQKPKQVQHVRQYTPPGAPRAFPPYTPAQQPSPLGQPRVLSPLQPPPQQQSQAPPAAPAPVNPPPRPIARPLNPPPPPPPRTPHPPAPVPEKRITTDPVISMLASRASSDPVLKALMKEVANGDATQEQLRIFQGHIDELTKIINDKKKKEEADAAAAAARTVAPVGQQVQGIKYEGQPNNHSSPLHKPYHLSQHPAPPRYRPGPIPLKPPSAPPPPPQPVILAFTGTGATEDRFLFPQYSILESLSPQHLLASFIVTRKGRESADPTGLEPETEYWQPITLMVEVAYKREHFLDFIKRWVKPADEVRKHMEETMARCTRAPITSLVLRLPFKGSELAESEEAGPEIALPLPTPPPEEKPKGKAGGAKYSRKKAAAEGTPKTAQPEKDSTPIATAPVTSATAATSITAATDVPAITGPESATPTAPSAPLATAPDPPPVPSPVLPAAPTSTVPETIDASKPEMPAPTTSAPVKDEKPDVPVADEESRPKRAVRKSARTSEGG